MKNILLIIFALICSLYCAHAEQILPHKIIENTTKITAPATGELGKNYFYCANGKKCSTEQVAREYYKNGGYKVMRAEYSFWKGMFVLAFLDELYPQTLNEEPKDKFFDKEKNDIAQEELNKKLKLIKCANIQTFINAQIAKHEKSSYIRWLDEWEIEGYKNPTEYFKSPVVQEFLTRVDYKTFYKIMKYILKMDDKNPVGAPDYIIWNNKEMIFVEVKRKSETLKPAQMKWGEFLIKNKIPYELLRVQAE